MTGDDALRDNTVLIIDDTPTNLGVVVNHLEDHGFQVLIAQDGEEGVQRAAYVCPDLILLDVVMPGIDGFEACRQLKANPHTRDIPVIFLTAMTDVRAMLAAFKAGGVDYVTKPLQIEEVLARVNTHLTLRATQRTLAMRNAALEQANQTLVAINERLQKAQSELMLAERMASIGQLAAGVAHEINNPIAFVQSNLGTLQEYFADLLAILDTYARAEGTLPADSTALHDILAVKERYGLAHMIGDLPDLLRESRDGCIRVHKIVENLKYFARPGGRGTWQQLDLEQTINSTVDLIAHELTSRIDVVREFAGVPPVECQPSRINLVIVNLLMNAAQAIKGPGRILLRTLHIGDAVVVEVIDSGGGIPEQDLPRLCDPFFTTLPAGYGSGVGLTLAHEVVRDHHGSIEIESLVGEGTCYRVSLPLRRAGPAGGTALAN